MDVVVVGNGAAAHEGMDDLVDGTLDCRRGVEMVSDRNGVLKSQNIMEGVGALKSGRSVSAES